MTSQDWASWIGAIGTAGATLIATITLALEAWWRRSDKRKEQAAHITAWVLTNQKSDQKTEDIIRISNQSFSPVYRCVATFVINEQDGRHLPADYRRIITALPPGEWQLATPKGWGGMHYRSGVEIAFTDAHGAHWMRNAVGQLHESPIDAIKHYEIELPYSSDRLTPATA
jgi:hypothetical protein